jgi:hypothetical protein
MDKLSLWKRLRGTARAFTHCNTFTRDLSDSEVERLFALSFALEQLHHNLIDLARCVQEWAGDVRAKTRA